MSRRYLLDTNTISIPIGKQHDLIAARWVIERSDECVICAPVWNELLFGCQKLPPGRRRNEVQTYIDEIVFPCFPILPYDSVAAEWHAKERAHLTKAGKTPPFIDGQIAAIARTRGLVLVTANQKDFASFRGLELENWLS